MKEENKKTLKELISETNLLTNAIELEAIETDGVINQDHLNELANLEDKQADKVERLAMFLDRLDYLTAHWKAEADQYQKIHRGFKNAHENLKNYIKTVMVQNQFKTLEGVSSKLVLRGSRPRLTITNPELIPEKYKKIIQTIELDNEKIRADLESFINVPGAKLEPTDALFRTKFRAGISDGINQDQ